ncbi:MAG TPA: TIGR01459 family HAD-type hydrolase [Candidatus Saccharimonadales bacterium]|nr:TIGR01459 family HAD-type hydrolase [Candidatus Saccharimonadales bacterium]
MIISGISEIIQNYDYLLIDQWGVIHDGNNLYEGVNECLENIKANKKHSIIITNSSRNKRTNQNLMANLNCNISLFSDVFTSADMLTMHMQNDEEFRKVYFVAEDEDLSVVENIINRQVENVEDSDAVVLLRVKPENEISVHDYWMKAAINKNIPLIVPTRDKSTVRTNGIFKGLDKICHKYESNGGQVVNFGKPEKYIYEHCMYKFKINSPKTVLAIGDQYFSDCVGAFTQGFDTLLVTTGAAFDNFNMLDNSTNKLCETIKGRSLDIPTYICESFRW